MHNLTKEPDDWYDFSTSGGYQSVDQGTLYLLPLLHIFLYNQYLKYVVVNYLL
jgi:hypothetical protein